jgi:hypothetical protein
VVVCSCMAKKSVSQAEIRLNPLKSFQKPKSFYVKAILLWKHTESMVNMLLVRRSKKSPFKMVVVEVRMVVWCFYDGSEGILTTKVPLKLFLHGGMYVKQCCVTCNHFQPKIIMCTFVYGDLIGFLCF